METKPRILYLQKILLERTDEENPLSTTQLINILNDEYGISAHRTTVTKDIAALQEFGMDIVTIHSTQSKYFVASRKFELPELKLLIDAVESSKFITKKKSETLIKKIHTMTSPGQVAKLKRNNYVVNRIKPDNEQIYYIIDAINDAINAGKQISFQYYDYTGMLISICYLILKGLLQTTSDGSTKLMDFLDEQRMCRLYEKFILEYYRKEHPEIKASASQIPWDTDDGYREMLPVMQSDIMLKQGDKTLVIDAKY